jgi:hypothetical protein
VAEEGNSRAAHSQFRRRQDSEGDQIRFFALAALLSHFIVATAAHGLANAAPAWRYEVAVSPDLSSLSVEAWIAAGYGTELSVDDGAEPFVHDVQIESSRGWSLIEEKDSGWKIDSCAAVGCHLRYQFALAAAARTLDSEVAENMSGAIQSPPTTWLLHPIDNRKSCRYRFHVVTPAGVEFVSGVNPVTGAPKTFEALCDDLADGPYSAFGALRVSVVRRSTATIDVAFAPGSRSLSDDDIRHWIQSAATALETYYGRLPLPRWLIIVTATEGSEAHGRTLGNGGATILLSVGRSMTTRDVPHDWVLTHEMIHLAFPNVSYRQRWIEEGIATYVEPIARARSGQLSSVKVWADLVDGLPNGEPQPGDHGFDYTSSWGSTYWGGALFCLVADIQIREATSNKHSLDDALRAILVSGENIAVRSSMAAVLAIGDRAVGGHVLASLYARMGKHAERVDLDGLWRRLGVQRTREGVTFDDRAPLAAIRRSITMPPVVSQPPPQN